MLDLRRESEIKEESDWHKAKESPEARLDFWQKAKVVSLDLDRDIDSGPMTSELNSMLDGLREQLTAQAATFEEKQPETKMIEFCCAPNSKLGLVGEVKHVEVFRVTSASCDVSTAAGMAKVLNYATNNPGCHIHGSLPCTAWSQIQELNIFQHGEPFAAKLRLAQKE